MVINVVNDGWCPFCAYWLWNNSVVMKAIGAFTTTVQINMNDDMNELLAKTG
jgi:hypothetical protein